MSPPGGIKVQCTIFQWAYNARNFNLNGTQKQQKVDFHRLVWVLSCMFSASVTLSCIHTNSTFTITIDCCVPALKAPAQSMQRESVCVRLIMWLRHKVAPLPDTADFYFNIQFLLHSWVSSHNFLVHSVCRCKNNQFVPDQLSAEKQANKIIHLNFLSLCKTVQDWNPFNHWHA